MMPKNYRVLIKELRGEIEKLRRVKSEAAEAQVEFGGLTDAPAILKMRGIASILADIYQGAEKAFLRVAKTTRESIPSGPDWHQALLNQMKREAPDLRPAVIQLETYTLLDDFRTLRHKVRHLYGFELKWDQLRPALEIAEQVVDAIVADLEAFCQWLDALGDDDA